MMKNLWLIPSLTFTCLFVILWAVVLACGNMSDGDYYNSSFFPPEITNDTAHEVFFYSPDNGSISINSYTGTLDFYNVNIIEWGNYFQKNVRDKDLEYLLYTARTGEIDTLIFRVKKSGFPISDTLKNNSVLKVKDTRSALDFLYYLGFAKRCEKYGNYIPEGWYDDDAKAKDPRNDKAGMELLINGGLKQMSNPKSDFIKQRYAFQLVRLYYMSKQFDKCIKFYDQQKALIESNTNSIKYRAMGYLAGAYYGNKDFGNADYLYSLVYDKSEIMRTNAYFSFHPQEEKDWNQTLALAKNNREKEVLWHILGIYNDPLRAMEEIYKLDPKSELLDLMLARAINEEERGFVWRYDMVTIKPKADSNGGVEPHIVNKDLMGFINTVADKENTTKPYEWDLAAGYLGWASGTAGFQNYLDKAKSEAPTDTLVLEEVKLIKLLDKVNNGKAGNGMFEEKLVPELIWLEVAHHPDHFPRDFAQQYILGELAQKYLAIGDSVKYECFATVNNEPITQNDYLLDEIKNFIDKKSKTIFDQYAINQLTYSKKDIVEIQASDLVYLYDFKGALARLNETDSAGGEALNCWDPFDIHINDCHECDDGREADVDSDVAVYDTSSVSTKKAFIERMIELESAIKKDPASRAINYYLLANGYYNITYFGNNKIMYETKISYMPYEGFYEYETSDTGNRMAYYMDCSKAEEYYNKAMNASKDLEFKAKCCFMAAKCEQNYFFCNKPKNYAGDFKAGKYFAMLKDNYSNTNYYQEIISECGYFKTYLGKNK